MFTSALHHIPNEIDDIKVMTELVILNGISPAKILGIYIKLA